MVHTSDSPRRLINVVLYFTLLSFCRMIWHLTTHTDQIVYFAKEYCLNRRYCSGHSRKRLFKGSPLLTISRHIYTETVKIHRRKVTLVIIDAQIDETYVPKMGYIKRGLVTNVYMLSSFPDTTTLEEAQTTCENELSTYYATSEAIMIKREVGKTWRPFVSSWNAVGEFAVGQPRNQIRGGLRNEKHNMIVRCPRLLGKRYTSRNTEAFLNSPVSSACHNSSTLSFVRA
jgi:hypothetical protein